MYQNKKVCLVIPAYNEKRLIKPTLTHVPDTIDRIYVIDDASTDGMGDVVKEVMKKDKRISLIQHKKNKGVGAGIITGYNYALKEGYDIAVVIGGDYQMDLGDLPNFLDPLINDEADYTKGNRFLYAKGIPDVMPSHRLFGNSMLSLMTKIASGYYKVFDTMDGYTAINKKALEVVDWKNAWKGYGYPAEFLIRLNAYGLKVKDVPRRAIYLKGERQSQIKVVKYMLKVMPMLMRGFFWRLGNKYVLRDFHPLVFFYIMGLMLFPLGLLLGFWIMYRLTFNLGISINWAILCALLVITGFQSILFAMFFDMEQSK
ncbi:glycosyltransferase family 2 protein [Candidatus Woesearchaeota archaeon]|nr:glycosyltransferase family 2 protein [Candidatus Woesearchaeota archaeon]